MPSPPAIDELCKKGTRALLNHLKVPSDELGVAAAATTDNGKLSLATPKSEEDNSKFVIGRAPSLKGEVVLAGAEVADLARESSDPVVIDLTDDDSVVVSSEWHAHLNLVLSPTRPSGTASCPICMDGYSEIVQSGRLIVSTICGHVFCSQCLRIALSNANSCPACRNRLTHGQCHPIYI
ncbi:E3 ubiquitin-protein ligase RNF4-like [Theristicus caerulescens]